MKKLFTILGLLFFAGIALAQSSSTYYPVSFRHGVFLRSESGVYTLRFQEDGNLVLYKNKTKPIWASQTSGRQTRSLIFQDDGNLVIYDANKNAVWSSNSHGKGGSYITLQNDGNLVIYTYQNKPVWASDTGGL
ncbi:MAG: bulb-type lectin domain-containing protein [Weeksellaceae bacterium]|jgi:hypothetical protein|nr:bulb-type lectin domain-containing protein [Weeksellaceae bacterium]MDX9705783.1 bulb-type lectin domain-containing protein [Weeksellaceae bacterium]